MTAYEHATMIIIMYYNYVFIELALTTAEKERMADKEREKGNEVSCDYSPMSCD